MRLLCHLSAFIFLVLVSMGGCLGPVLFETNQLPLLGSSSLCPLLVCWSAGLPVCWFAGLLMCFFVDLLVCWFAGWPAALLVCCPAVEPLCCSARRRPAVSRDFSLSPACQVLTGDPNSARMAPAGLQQPRRTPGRRERVTAALS